MGSKLFPSKIEKTTILNSQSIRMLQTHVKNDIYNKYCLIHNTISSVDLAQYEVALVKDLVFVDCGTIVLINSHQATRVMCHLTL